MQNGVSLDRCHENPSEDSEKVPELSTIGSSSLQSPNMT